MDKKFIGIDSFILFGGGKLFCHFANRVKSKGFKIFVVTSQRHAEERVGVNGETCAAVLASNDLSAHISTDISLDDTIIRTITPTTLGISISAAWIFKKSFIDIFGGRLLNVHGSRLPQDRGGGGKSWQILRNNFMGGVTLHQLDPGIDTGNIFLQEQFEYPQSCISPAEFDQVFFEKGCKLLENFLDKIERQENFLLASQNENESSYWPRLNTDINGYIDWSWSVEDIRRFINAFSMPYQGASTFLNGQRIFINSIQTSRADGTFHPFQAGLVYRHLPGEIFVAATDGSLIFSTITNAAGEDISSSIRVGDRLYTPLSILEEAKMTRVFYTPEGLKKK